MAPTDMVNTVDQSGKVIESYAGPSLFSRSAPRAALSGGRSLGCHVYAKRDVVLVMRKGSCSRDVKWCHLDRVSMRILRLGSPVGVKHGTHGHA
jgi:hypothetical protein